MSSGCARICWRRTLHLAAPLVLGALAVQAETGGEEGATLAQALKEGRPILSLRYRYEDVSDDGVGDLKARASTLRTTFGYRSLAWKGWSVLLEGENVTSIGNDLYNNAGVGDSNNGVRDRPVVADPAGTELNQAYLQLGVHDSTLRLGRQEITLGDQRFIGNVGWRQNHQSYDAVSVAGGPWSRFSFFYGFIDTVNRINFGRDPMASHLVNGTFDLRQTGKITLYGYWLDYDEPGRFASSTRTLGAEWSGSRAFGEGRALLWEAEYADQGDFGDNPARLSADYLFVMLGARFGSLTARAGYEVLSGGSEGGAFQTPLATLHKFNGWADKFLSTPLEGLEDLYLQLDGTVGSFTWSLRLHDFSAEASGASYGSELDAQLFYTAPWKQGFGLKGAFYGADEFAADTDKIWVFTTWSI